MCDPVVGTQIARGSLNVAGEVLNQRAQRSLAEDNQEIATTNANTRIARSISRQFQENTRVIQEQFERKRQGVRERSKLNALIGESGVSGGSSVRQLVTSFIQEDIDLGVIDTNKEFSDDKFTQDRADIVTEAQSTIKSIRSGVDNKFTSALKIIRAGVGG
jgi:hypothetical protein